MSVLRGLKVIEMSAIGPVPFAGMLLADMGADVVVADKPNDLWRMPHDVMRRGKRAFTADMKSPDDIESMQALLDQADILIEGFRPGVMERLGLGPDKCLARNPRLIYGRMTGWGQTGPLAQAAGHDINYIALTGALQAIGRGNDNPTPPLNLVGDYGGGAMFLVMGVLAALYERQHSGQGQVIDAAITEGTANLMSFFYTLDKVGAWSTQRASNMLDSGAHFYDTYATQDNKFVSIGAIEPQFYALLIDKLGLDKDAFQAQHDSRQWPALKQQIADAIKTKTQQQWCDLLEGSDVCFAPVLDYTQAPEHPHMQAREAYLVNDNVTQPAPAPRFSRTPSKVSEGDDALITPEAVLAQWQA